MRTNVHQIINYNVLLNHSWPLISSLVNATADPKVVIAGCQFFLVVTFVYSHSEAGLQKKQPLQIMRDIKCCPAVALQWSGAWINASKHYDTLNLYDILILYIAFRTCWNICDPFHMTLKPAVSDIFSILVDHSSKSVLWGKKMGKLGYEP